jgi:hypothetical protein
VQANLRSKLNRVAVTGAKTLPVLEHITERAESIPEVRINTSATQAKHPKPHIKSRWL